MATPTVSFKPKQVVKRLLGSLPDRAREIIVFRYGIGKDERRLTLDAIGKKYGITRERVRQIEAYALGVISDEHITDHERCKGRGWMPSSNPYGDAMCSCPGSTGKVITNEGKELVKAAFPDYKYDLSE